MEAAYLSNRWTKDSARQTALRDRSTAGSPLSRGPTDSSPPNSRPRKDCRPIRLVPAPRRNREPARAGWMDSHVYSRSNTRTSLGLLWPTMRTVIVKVLRSVESSICRVSVILPWNLKRGKPRFRGWFLADRPRISLFHSQRLHWINPRRPPCRNKAGQGRHN